MAEEGTARRVLITGGTGFLGRPLSAELARRGYDVVVLSREPDRVSSLPPGVRVAGWDAASADGWAALLDGCHGVVNLAGDSIGTGRWTAQKKRSVRDSRLRAGAAVVEAVASARRKPAVLVQSSAVGYYGNRGDEELAESSPPGTGFLAETCLAWEASTAAVEGLGVRRAVARTGLVLSLAGGAFPKLVLPYRLLAGGPMGDGRQWMPWIHLVDEVAALCFLLENSAASGPFNLCAPQPVTNAELGKAIGVVLHRPSVLRAPAFALRALLGEMSELVLDGQRVVPARLLELGFVFRFGALRPALEDLLR